MQMARNNKNKKIFSQPKAVGEFTDPKTKQKIRIFPKKGETPSHATNRVRSKHK
jgi:hypothetical protein